MMGAEEVLGRVRKSRIGEALEGEIRYFHDRNEQLLHWVQEGEVTVRGWSKEFVELIHDLSLAVGRLGVRLGQILSQPVVDAAHYVAALAAKVAHEQAKFVRGFRRDLEAGVYGVVGSAGFDLLKVLERTVTFAYRAYGTANEAMVSVLGDDAVIYWRLGPNVNHCSVCPERAAGGPYTKASLPRYPGDGNTPCSTNCKCFLEVDGVAVTDLARR